MAVLMSDAVLGTLPELRYEPVRARVRAELDGREVVRTDGALLVWEPRRVVPTYAVPAADLRAELRPAEPAPPSDAPILHPGIPFAVHSCPGEPLTVRADGRERAAAAFRPADPALADHVVLDVDAFAFFEEDERVVGHPRDPFHRVEALRSSRRVRIELDGELLAESARPTMVLETQLPVRFYLPRADVRVPLHPSATRTVCPYKGEASYWSVDAGGGRVADVAWSYEAPVPAAAPLAGLVAFWDERVDVVIDGEHRAAASGDVADALRDEFAVP